MVNQRQPWLIAHRGASLEAPENTLAAFQRAMELRADLIELDIHQTADGHIVVIHDETVARTTDGVRPVRAMTLEELSHLDAGSWFGQDFAGARIPTLLEVLELTQESIGLAIEIKAGSSRYPGLEATLVQLLQRTGRLDDVIIISADCQAIRTVRRLERRLATACFRHGSPRCWRWYRRLGLVRRWHSDYLFIWPEQVTPAVINEVHHSGLKIITSLERTPSVNVAEVQRLANAGVDGIIADDVALLVQILAADPKKQS